MASPFNSLIGLSEQLIESLENNEYGEASEYSRHIHRTSTETCDLIMSLLNCLRTQLDRISIKPGLFNMTELLNEVSQLAENQAGRKNITVEVETLEDINVYADKALISMWCATC